jgi:ubiquinone/menaquinone biosynthesis C-methylase UbiE
MTSSTDSPLDERLRLEFNEWARAGRGESMEKGHRPIGEQAIKLMFLKPTARVLDVGCGSGWASRILASLASQGHVVGIDISDEMVSLASASSLYFANVEFRVASAEDLPFPDKEFTDAFSMESLYYYSNIPRALSEIHRVLKPGGIFLTVVDLYQENEASHQWVEQLKVPVQLLSTSDYEELFRSAGFANVRSQRLLDPAPIPTQYSGSSFKTHDDYVKYRLAGSLVIKGGASK